jgi:hypothetical protein
MISQEQKVLATRAELRKHTFATFRNDRGVIVSGCPACRKHLPTLDKFVEHLAVDIVPYIPDPGGADVWQLVRAARSVLAANNNVGGRGSVHELSHALGALAEVLERFPILQ